MKGKAEWDALVDAAFALDDDHPFLSQMADVDETRALSDWDESKHPRDDHGRWTDAAGAFVSDLREGKSITIGTHQLKDFLEHVADLPGTPPDLARVKVEGADVFSKGLGIERKDMPQIPREHRESFIQDLKLSGVSVDLEHVKPTSLRPVQSQLDAQSIGAYMRRYEPGKEPSPVFVSADNYVLDGHHRWATQAAVEIAKIDPSVRTKVFRIGLDHRAALGVMNAYNDKKGIKRLEHGGAIAASDMAWWDAGTDPLYDDDVALTEEAMGDLACPHCGSAVRYVGIGMADWDESKHPRDDAGRFATVDGGGGGDDTGEGSHARLESHHHEIAEKHGVSREDLAAAHKFIVENASTPIEKAHAADLALAEAIGRNDLKNGDTESRYRQADGNWTKEREEVHDKAIVKFFQDFEKKHGNMPPSGLEHPTVTFMAGLSGAGKSTATKDIQQYGSNKVVVVDPDHLKQYLPEYKGGLGSMVVARESGYLGDKLMAVATNARMNIVIDGTMKTSGRADPTLGDGALGKMAAFKDRGYRVEVRYVDVTVDQSIHRVVQRYIEEKQTHGTGRYVPPSFPRSMRDDQYDSLPRRSFEMAKATTYRGKPLIDAWVHKSGWTGDTIGEYGTLSRGGVGE